MMLETERVMCDLQSVLSTAQSLQILFLQVMQKARRGSSGCVGHFATVDFDDSSKEAAEPGTWVIALETLLAAEDEKGRPFISFHAMICARIDTLGNRVLLTIGWLVVGDVECDASQSVIDARSYVIPSAATTGSSMISQEKVISQS